jgi:hypothetical protein
MAGRMEINDMWERLSAAISQAASRYIEIVVLSDGG